MTAFAPVDPRVPNARRKQLVAKLMQQQQSAQTPQRQSAITATTGLVGRVGGRPGGVQHSNVLASVLSKLGVGGRGDVDQSFSPHIQGYDPYSTGHYVSPREVSPDTAVSPSTPTTSAQDVVAQIHAQGDTNTASQAQQLVDSGGAVYAGTLPDGTSTNDNANTWGSSNPSGLIPLGNGMYYDPVLDQVGVHGPATGLGIAARGI